MYYTCITTYYNGYTVYSHIVYSKYCNKQNQTIASDDKETTVTHLLIKTELVTKTKLNKRKTV